MSTNVIMPVLGMVQDTGKIVRWVKKVGEEVKQGELLLEIETDKAIQELESPSSGIVGQILAQEGDDVPVTQVVAIILTPEEYKSASPIVKDEVPSLSQQNANPVPRTQEHPPQVTISASPLAARMAQENHLDLAQIKPQGGRVEKADVIAFLKKNGTDTLSEKPLGRVLASPKARRIAKENNIDLALLHGSGPNGAVLTPDVERGMRKIAESQAASQVILPVTPVSSSVETAPAHHPASSSTIWRRMAEHTTASWTTAPHFYLQRTVKAARLLAWHAHLQQRNQQAKITITDLLILIVSRSLRRHPNINSVWQDEKVNLIDEINISLAVAVNDGLVVPVIHNADQLGMFEIAEQRKALLARAESNRLKVEDISGGTFTISNLGMFGVDTFNAVLNKPQAGILAVGQISDHVLPVNGVPAILPTMNLSVSFDHRAIDGVNGAKFLQTLTELIEEPLGLVS